ncbi:VirB8/TrbF family protein [Marinibaculum pumilum]|uniref:VirB8/TrbF family protein n=1 Tax=Marinibaculum pumilum TaxID=1766165 RepID=A0ABV7L7I0_9PROT
MRSGHDDLVPAGLPPTKGRVRGNRVRSQDEAYVRRLERLVKASWALAGLGVGLAGSMGTVVLGLFPLKSTEHVLVQFDQPSAQLVRLIPERIDRRTEELLTEDVLRRYVDDRETINLVDENLRYGWVQAHSTDRVYAEFRDRMTTSNADSPLNEFAEKKLVREVHILSAGPVPGSSGTWQVEFTTIDRRDKTAVQRGEWVATMRVYRTAIEGVADRIRLNPLGLRVAGYAVRKRSLGGEAGL